MDLPGGSSQSHDRGRNQDYKDILASLNRLQNGEEMDQDSDDLQFLDVIPDELNLPILPTPQPTRASNSYFTNNNTLNTPTPSPARATENSTMMSIETFSTIDAGLEDFWETVFAKDETAEEDSKPLIDIAQLLDPSQVYSDSVLDPADNEFVPDYKILEIIPISAPAEETSTVQTVLKTEPGDLEPFTESTSATNCVHDEPLVKIEPDTEINNNEVPRKRRKSTSNRNCDVFNPTQDELKLLATHEESNEIYDPATKLDPKKLRLCILDATPGNVNDYTGGNMKIKTANTSNTSSAIVSSINKKSRANSKREIRRVQGQKYRFQARLRHNQLLFRALYLEQENSSLKSTIQQLYQAWNHHPCPIVQFVPRNGEGNFDNNSQHPLIQLYNHYYRNNK